MSHLLKDAHETLGKAENVTKERKAQMESYMEQLKTKLDEHAETLKANITEHANACTVESKRLFNEHANTCTEESKINLTEHVNTLAKKSIQDIQGAISSKKKSDYENKVEGKTIDIFNRICFYYTPTNEVKDIGWLPICNRRIKSCAPID
ncbi:hypothetical protein DPMN_161797 [Dreissena polymorpha]|uniref:Uncharacterized protein n=1 Tax=Dreissena polymorpha TaxID=45954 RepID=A0A9D4IT12_DREPO|nr:hypothetical protein DPMN_161797 [Dreissena polymorpha]